MRPIEIAFTADDYVEALTLHALWSRRRLLVHLGIALAGAAVVFATFPNWPSIVGGGVLGGVIGGFACHALSRLFYLPWKARRLFAQQKSLHERYEMTWSDEGISAHGPRSQGLARWDDFIRRKENSHIVLLYYSDVLFHMLPKRLFTAEQWQSLQSHVDRVGS